MGVFSTEEIGNRVTAFKTKLKAWRKQGFINATKADFVTLEQLMDELNGFVSQDLLVRFEIDEILATALVTDDGDGDRGTDKAIEVIANISVETLEDGVYTEHADDTTLAAAAGTAEGFFIKINITPTA